MKKIFKKFDSKISIYFFIFSMIIVFILSLTSYNASLDLFLENKRNQTEQEIKNVSLYIASYLDKIKGLSNLIAMTPNINSIANDSDNYDEPLENIINIIQKNDNIIKRISIISVDGKLITTSRVDLNISNNMLNENWYIDSVKSENMPMITTEDHMEFTMNKTHRIISISKEIFDNEGKHIGLVLIDLSYKFIEDYVSQMNFGSEGYAFILTSENKLLFDSKQMNNESLIEKKEYIELSNNVDATDDKFVGKSILIPNTDWLLVGLSSTEQIDLLTNKLVNSMLTWALIILLASVVLSILISRWITKPVKSLIFEMKKIDRDFNFIEVDKFASLEIVKLSNEYNSLIKKISKLTKSIEEKENNKRIYELKALQSQINPHFIYNTLDTILWLIEFNENDKAIDVVKSLGQILRSTLNINQDFIELHKELEHVKNYMNIQKIRYDDKFEYIFDIAKHTEKILVPKLILQPIVENAIYHGIKPKKSNSHIKISSKIEDEDLILVVEDNGVGFSNNKTKNMDTKLGGIGMENVDQRIKILCGNEYGISLKQDDNVTRIVYKLKI